MTQPETTSPFDEQMKRIHLVTHTRTQKGLAKFLGVRRSVVSDIKRRGEIPAEWLLTLLRSQSANPEWILTGMGPCRVSIHSTRYIDVDTAREQMENEQILLRVPSRMLADELVRRIAVADAYGSLRANGETPAMGLFSRTNKSSTD